MSREGQKRFCGACKKHVHDLSAMKPDQARALLAAAATAELCVRYLYDESGNLLFQPSADLLPANALTRVRRFVTAAGVLVIPLSLNACMGAAPPPPAPPIPTASATATAIAPPTTSETPDAGR